jgi:hypothetical protein
MYTFACSNDGIRWRTLRIPGERQGKSQISTRFNLRLLDPRVLRLQPLSRQLHRLLLHLKLVVKVMEKVVVAKVKEELVQDSERE